MTLRCVDLFAGAGGTSTGAVLAGARVLAAVNHWRTAVDTHALNHPATAHHCEDAAILDPTTLPARDALPRLRYRYRRGLRPTERSLRRSFNG